MQPTELLMLQMTQIRLLKISEQLPPEIVEEELRFADRVTEELFV